jgi:conjugal transfer pilus assembly protein TraF
MKTFLTALTLTIAAPVGGQPVDLTNVSGSTDPSTSVQKNWFERGEEGWYWYRDPPKEPEEPIDETDEIVESAPDPVPESLYPPLDREIDSLAELERVKKAVESAQARVVLQPTEAHVHQWLAVTHEMNERSALFADQLRRTVWATPQYDYSLVRPNNPSALGAWTAAYNDDRRKSLKEISRTYGLYFFVSGSCEYCHQFAPYLKRFSETYGFDVLAVSIDGGTVPEFSNAVYSPAFAERLSVRTTPAVFLANPRANDIRPVAYGMISLSELENRIYRLFRMEPGQVAFQLGAAQGAVP